jgi:hypothetical protein
MRTSQILSSLVVASVLATGVATLLPAVAQTSQPSAAPVDAAPKGKPLTIAQVLDKLEAAGYRNIQKVEAQRNGFEIYATNREGQRVELDVDNITGQVKRSSAKDEDDKDRSSKGSRSESGSGQR